MKTVVSVSRSAFIVKAYLMALALASLPGCASLESRLDAAAQQQGQAQARVTLPDAPIELRKQEAHAAIAEGMEALSVLKRERAALDRANARVGRWAAFYGALKAKLK